MNPYEPPCYSLTSQDDERALTLVVYVAGFILSLVVALAVLTRFCSEVNSFGGLSELALDGGANAFAAIVALGLSAWLSLGALSCMRRFIPSDQMPFSCALVLVAMSAILVRAITEPATCWTPMWPTYLLTFSGVGALALLLRQLRAFENIR